MYFDLLECPLEVLQAINIISTKRQFQPKLDLVNRKILNCPLINLKVPKCFLTTTLMYLIV